MGGIFLLCVIVVLCSLYVLLLLFSKNKYILEVLCFYKKNSGNGALSEENEISNNVFFLMLKKRDISYEVFQIQCLTIFSREIILKTFFGVMASVGPLLGLLGTIWGIINVFSSLHDAASIDIAVVAPGISEALLTTLFSLFLAIPALIMFHFVGAYLKNIFYKLELIYDFSMRDILQKGCSDA